MSIQSDKYELDNRTAVNHEGRDANRPPQRLTAKSIIGDSVESRLGEKMGTIDNLMINLQNGSVDYAVIEFGSFLGIGGKLFAIPFQELQLNADRKVFVLDRDKEHLKQSPGFDKDHWPDTNEH